MSKINFLPPWVETNLQPAFYDKESGTVLQQTARMYAKVNQLVRSVNEQNETIADYIQQFIDLKDYCEDYFDNLDVQEEINKKLDLMVEDGSFQPLLDITFSQYYDALKTYTDNYLTAKVDKDGVGQVTYNNLSQSVKEMFTGGNTPVVGVNSVTSDNIVDASISYQKLDSNGKNGVAGFNTKKKLVSAWEQGSRHGSPDGSLVSSTNTIVIDTPITLKYGMRIKCNAGYKCFIYSWTSGTIFSLFAGFQSVDLLMGNNFPEAHLEDEFYISVRHTDDSDITPSEGGDSIEITENQSNVKSSYASLDSATQNLILGNNSSIAITDSFSFANALDNGQAGAKYYYGMASESSNNRGVLNTPIYLPAGTVISTDDVWEFVIVTASSYITTEKVFYPSGIGWVNRYEVAYPDTYYIAFRNSSNTSIGSNAHEFTSHLSIVLPASARGVKTLYVSGGGNDTTGDGSYSNPYRQISKAINEGANTVICASGYKYAPLELSSKNNIRIIGDMPTYSTASKVQQKPYFDNSVILTGNTLDSGKIKIAYVAEKNTDMYDCLVAKTKPLKDNASTRSDGYYCTIFSDGGKDVAHRYIPVLTQDDVAGHFYYDGSYIYINPYSNNDVDNEYSLIDTKLESKSKLVSLNKCDNITFENITFKHASEQLFYAKNSSGIKIVNSEFHGSSKSDNMAVVDTNIELIQCVSYLARNDGYNFHGFGTSIVSKCIGCNCFDDGISHHDKCSHTILGGEYYGNNKGGVSSPTYGCSGDIIGVYSHDNTTYGIMSSSDTTYGKSYVNLNNNVVTNNSIGISLNRADGIAYNNKTINNSTNIVNNSDVVIY